MRIHHSYGTPFGLICLVLLQLASAACVSNTSSTQGLQNLIKQGGAGFTLSLCQGQVYNVTQTINYTAANQEISTEGYPRDDTRATLQVVGFNVSTAVQAQDPGCDGARLRNIQINGNRGNDPIYYAGNANIEFGGQSADQLVEFVHSYDPRGWSCIHMAEGPFECRNATIQYNDIGPCGSESFQQWSDGISLSCESSLVQGNVITDPTDGGIVIFGSPNSTIRNNTIQVQTRTLLGGINLVDVVPWQPVGNFSGVMVENNFINGGFATQVGNATHGYQNASAIIKLGISIGPNIWFGDRYGKNQTWGATVQNNQFSGAFAFGMAISGARQDTIQNNTFVGNVSFIGTYGPNCTTGNETPHPPVPLIIDPTTTNNMNISVGTPVGPMAASVPGTSAFQSGSAGGLTCFMPPANNVAVWPYGGGGMDAEPTPTASGAATSAAAITVGKGLLTMLTALLTGSVVGVLAV